VRSPHRSPDQLALTAIKVLHWLIFLLVETSIQSVINDELSVSGNRGTAVAGGIVAAEILIIASCGFRCPLTSVTERLSAGRGSVTDISLPHVPLLALAVWLHRDTASLNLVWRPDAPTGKGRDGAWHATGSKPS